MNELLPFHHSVFKKLPVRPEIAPLTSPNIIPNKAAPQGSELSPGLSLSFFTAALKRQLELITQQLQLKRSPNFHHWRLPDTNQQKKNLKD